MIILQNLQPIFAFVIYLILFYSSNANDYNWYLSDKISITLPIINDQVQHTQYSNEIEAVSSALNWFVHLILTCVKLTEIC